MPASIVAIDAVLLDRAEHFHAVTCPRIMREVKAWIQEHRYRRAGPGYDLMSAASRASIRPLLNAAEDTWIYPMTPRI